ncbi:PAS domain-containing protein [Emcibacter nanhaiensis]|nr:PAS domain-containing protein [Emcibacter nanhaiensis]
MVTSTEKHNASSQNSNKESHFLLEEAPLMDPSRIRNARLREILDFWEAHKRGDDVPLWKTFNPMEFPDMLPTISVFSNEGTAEEPDYLLRVEGERSAEIMGLPTSMTSVSKLHSYFSNTKLGEQLDIMARHKRPIYFIRNLGWKDHRDYINYEILSLPFATEADGPVDRFLSVKIFTPRD